MTPNLCPALPVDHAPQTALLKELRAIPGVDRVFIASGIRHDLILEDEKSGPAYLENIVKHHVGGQMKIAPEHVSPSVLKLMRKPGGDTLLRFKEQFDAAAKKAASPVFLTYYFIAAHPGCTEADMEEVSSLASKRLGILPEQVQIFTPLPSTWAALMYYTEQDPFTGRPLFVEKDLKQKEAQKSKVTEKGYQGPKSSKRRRP